MAEGYTSMGPVLSRDQVRRSRHAVYSMFNTTMATIRRLGLQEQLANVGFTSFKLRHLGRYDLEVGAAVCCAGGFF